MNQHTTDKSTVSFAILNLRTEALAGYNASRAENAEDENKVCCSSLVRMPTLDASDASNRMNLEGEGIERDNRRCRE